VEGTHDVPSPSMDPGTGSRQARRKSDIRPTSWEQLNDRRLAVATCGVGTRYQFQPRLQPRTTFLLKFFGGLVGFERVRRKRDARGNAPKVIFSMTCCVVSANVSIWAEPLTTLF
jgi:hypothetical protein